MLFRSWAAELPVTLCNAAVTDTGITAGYGYSHGPAGRGNNGPGTLNALLIDPRGGVLLDDPIPRQPGNIGVWAEPNGEGVWVHPTADRFILILDSGPKDWHAYQLSTGKKLETFYLHDASHAPDAAREMVELEPLTGLPLVLVQWWYYDADESGTLFSIVDLNGHSVWSHSLPRDYSIPGDDDAEDRLHKEIWHDSAILEVGNAGTFALRHVADGTRVDFQIARDKSAETGWTVTKTSSKPYVPKKEHNPEPRPAPKEQLAAVPQLKSLGSFQLQDRPAAGAIRGIQEFDIDAEGRIGFLRHETDGTTSFALVDTQANVIAEIQLPEQKQKPDKEEESEDGEEDTTTLHTAWLGGTRWIITTSPYAEGATSRAWWLDVNKRSVEKIGGFESPSIQAISGTRDGGFVAIATHQQKYSRRDYIISFDAAGKQVWKHEASSDDKPETLLSPEDLTVTTRGEIAILDNILKQVKWFALDGSHLRTTSLEKAWQREPNYPTGITPDAAGGIIIDDFDDTPHFVRMRPDGTVVNEFTPKRPDGRAIDADTGLSAAPDGSIWACDGDAFIQLTDQGVALRDIGFTADDDTLGEIAAVAGDAQGTLYLLDRRTAAVHVFGPDGAKLRICKPAKDDFTGHVTSTHLTVANDGGVLVRLKEDEEKRERYLAYGPDGARTGIKQLGLDDITEEWYSQPGTGNTLVLGYKVAFLVDPAGKLLEKIERQADRRWFDDLGGAAFAADGSFVIESQVGYPGRSDLTFLDAAGKPIATVTPPTKGWATLGGYDGRHVTLASEHAAQVYDRHGKVIAATPRNDGNFTHLLAHDGKELWIIEHVSHAVTRYVMPD